MQLDYKVLFVDDEGFDGYMGELRDAIDSHLQKIGFVLQGIEIINEEDLISKISTDKLFDIIFVDNRFDDEECGIEFIKKIRNAKIYADIVLCTAQSDNDLIKKINAETAHHGFYYIRKGQNLFQHAYNVIDFRFNKELDTNVMRGIAMSEVAKFDNYILEIILKDDIHKSRIINNVKEKAKKRYNDTHSSEADEEIWKMVTNPETSTIYFESTMRKEFLHAHVLKKIDMLKECYTAIKDNYGIEILKKRNDLAHKIEPDLSIDEKKQLRKDIIKFRKIFEQIRKHFKLIPEGDSE